MKGLLIPVTGPVREVEWDEDNPQQWEEYVDARPLDMITIRNAGLQAIIGDWSLVDESPHNIRASWFMLGLGRGNRINGNALIVGVDPETGEGMSVYPALVDAAVVLPTPTPGA